jgi:SET and MYND domain-containing protein 4
MKKSDKKAGKFRKIGNDLFADGRFCEALLAYNHSLLFAKPGSIELALSYGNRSAVYCEIKEYQLSLENIELARAHGYPQEKSENLQDREKRCLEMIKLKVSARSHEIELKMSFPCNPRVPGLADCLQIQENEEFGKHLVSNCDLKAGDIIASYDPTLLYFDKRARLYRCSHCADVSKKLSLIPCTNCTKGKHF